MSYDLVVIGGGAGGLGAARAGIRLGKRTVMVQDGRIGGDCTFTGCVPSKTLIEAASQGRTFEQAMAKLNEVVERIAATENFDVLKSEGIDVIEGRASFSGTRALSVGNTVIRADRIVIATGSSAVLPPISGLRQIPYLTNENVFKITYLPSSLIVLGGGAIGCELAQVFGRFGTKVHILEGTQRLLPREEPEASATVAEALRREGITLHLGVKVIGVEPSLTGHGIRVSLANGSSIDGEELLVAVGRRPVTDGLAPEEGGVALDEHGYIKTDPYLRTTSKGVYAVGDVTGRLPFTHAADEMGRIAVRNGFRRLRRDEFNTSAIPWVTFTDPEVARVGITESEAAASGAQVAYLPMASVDRAVMSGRTEGFVKLIAAPRPLLRNTGGGRLVGATIVCPRAGEMVHEIALAIRTNMFTGRLAQTVHAYPSWSTSIRQAAAQFFFDLDGYGARKAKVSD